MPEKPHMPNVQRAGADHFQLLACQGAFKNKVYAGMLPPELQDALGRLRLHGRADMADPDPAGFPAPHGADHVFGLLQACENAFGFLQQGLAFPGERHPAAGAVKQPRAQFLFQFSYLLRQRRLGHVQPLGRPTEMKFPRHGRKVTKLPAFHD